MRKGNKGLCALGRGVKHHARQTVARRLGQANVTRNDGVEHLVAKVGFELLADLLLQGDAGVEHDAQQADDGQVFVQIGMHLLDGVDQIGQAFKGKVFALHGHNNAVSAAQAIEREHGQTRGAVNQHKVVLCGDFCQGLLEAALAPFHIHQLHLSPGQLPVGAQNVVAATTLHQLVAFNARLCHRGRLQQYVVNTERQLSLIHPRTHGGIALRVEVDHQHALPHLGQTRRQVDGGSGFANATFLVGDAENFGHGVLT